MFDEFCCFFVRDGAKQSYGKSLRWQASTCQTFLWVFSHIVHVHLAPLCLRRVASTLFPTCDSAMIWGWVAIWWRSWSLLQWDRDTSGPSEWWNNGSILANQMSSIGEIVKSPLWHTLVPQNRIFITCCNSSCSYALYNCTKTNTGKLGYCNDTQHYNTSHTQFSLGTRSEIKGMTLNLRVTRGLSRCYLLVPIWRKLTCGQLNFFRVVEKMLGMSSEFSRSMLGWQCQMSNKHHQFLHFYNYIAWE